MLLKHGVWLAYEGSDQIIPLFGSYKHMHETLSKEHGITFAYTTFRDLVLILHRAFAWEATGRSVSRRSAPRLPQHPAQMRAASGRCDRPPAHPPAERLESLYRAPRHCV